MSVKVVHRLDEHVRFLTAEQVDVPHGPARLAEYGELLERLKGLPAVVSASSAS
jgi:hypothetical protein